MTFEDNDGMKSLELCFIICLSVTLMLLKPVHGAIANADIYKDGKIDLSLSPFKDLCAANSKSVLNELKAIFSDNPTENPGARYRSAVEKIDFVNSLSKKHPQFFAVLPLKGDTSPSMYIQRSQDPSVKAAAKALAAAKPERVADKPVTQLVAYQIFDGSPKGKKQIVVWAKEHADEYGTSEFALNLTEFILAHLTDASSKANHPVISAIFHDFFAKRNLVIVPDVTMDINVRTKPEGAKGKYGFADANWYGVLLQPFNFDALTAEQALVAPEAQFLKDLFDAIENPLLGVNLHSPFSVTTVTKQHPQHAVLARVLAAEVMYSKKFALALSPNQNFVSKVVKVDQVISTEIIDSASYFSRTRGIPTIFHEMDEMNYSASDGDQHFQRDISFRNEIPVMLRLFEIATSLD